jgi:hypothetical protein
MLRSFSTLFLFVCCSLIITFSFSVPQTQSLSVQNMSSYLYVQPNSCDIPVEEVVTVVGVNGAFTFNRTLDSTYVPNSIVNETVTSMTSGLSILSYGVFTNTYNQIVLHISAYASNNTESATFKMNYVVRGLFSSVSGLNSKNRIVFSYSFAIPVSNVDMQIILPTFSPPLTSDSLQFNYTQGFPNTIVTIGTYLVEAHVPYIPSNTLFQGIFTMPMRNSGCPSFLKTKLGIALGIGLGVGIPLLFCVVTTMICFFLRCYLGAEGFYKFLQDLCLLAGGFLGEFIYALLNNNY